MKLNYFNSIQTQPNKRIISFIKNPACHPTVLSEIDHDAVPGLSPIDLGTNEYVADAFLDPCPVRDSDEL